jgi:hypothetical protein
MPKRSRRGRSPDLNRRAWEIVQEATGQAPPPPDEAKNPAAVALGRLGGKKGGKARAESLTPRQRSISARKAARARWSK